MLQNAREDSSGNLYYVMQDGSVVYFTVDPHLQKTLNTLMATYPKDIMGILLMDARSGRILAIGGRFKGERSLRSFKRSDYPAASVFKLITAIAAVDYLGMVAEDTLEFCGPLYRRRPRRWLNCRGDSLPKVSLALAFGRSINPVFGRIGVHLGRGAFEEVSERLFFGDTLWGLAMGYVSFDSVRDDNGLALLGSGFNYSYLNPVHASLLAQVMATGNVWKPYVVDRVEKGGEVTYRSSPELVSSPLSGSTLREIKQMAKATVDSGTVYNLFHDRYGRPLLNVSVGGKTGTLRSKKHGALTEWFVGFAPVENPEVVIVVFSVDNTLIHIKTPYLAMRMLQAYFLGEMKGTPLSYKRYRKRKRTRRRKGGG